MNKQRHSTYHMYATSQASSTCIMTIVV